MTAESSMVFVGTLDTLRESLQAFHGLGGPINPAYFFRQQLYPYFETWRDGITSEMGHVLYRLADRFPEEDRELMPIYPSDGGTLYLRDSGCWTSLEDWRRDWERMHPEGIPTVEEMTGRKALAEMGEFFAASETRPEVGHLLER